MASATVLLIPFIDNLGSKFIQEQPPVVYSVRGSAKGILGEIFVADIDFYGLPPQHSLELL